MPPTHRTNAKPKHPLTWPGTAHWERLFAVFLHLTILLYHVLIPVLPVLLLWLWRRNRSRFVDDHGRQALNFQITLLVYAAAATLISLVTCGAAVYVLAPAIYILGAAGTVLACIAAKAGRAFRYPMTIPFLPGAV